MNRIKKTALVAFCAALGSVAAQAQYVQGDLLLGFRTGTAANDLESNLGLASNVGIGGSTVVDLSGFVSLADINSTFSGGFNNVDVGVVGARNTSPIAGSPNAIYVTQTRSSLGTPSVAGSATPPSVANLYGTAQLDIQTAGSGFNAGSTAGLVNGHSVNVVRGDAQSWSSVISQNDQTVAGSFYGDTGINPNGNTGTGLLLYEDLYQELKGAGQNFVYMGYFTLSDNGSAVSLTFTPSGLAVPEPSVYGLLAGAGLLLVSLRHQIRRKQA
jgi:hypothetical protein